MPFERLRGADRPVSADEVLADLVAFHEDSPGITEATLGQCTTDDGRTGYDVLVDHIPPGTRAVLELGCGNGPLLASLAARRPEVTQIVGVDLCRADLELARARVPSASLHCVAAQSLPLENHSVDAVVSHHAFYLFDPIEPVVSEIARVLRPGGTFHFATLDPSIEPHSTYAELMRAFGPLTRRDSPHFSGWGDRRVWSLDGLDALFAIGFETPVRVDPFVVWLEGTPASVCERLMRFFYSVQLQHRATRDELRRVWESVLDRERQTDGSVRMAFPSSVISVRRT